VTRLAGSHDVDVMRSRQQVLSPDFTRHSSEVGQMLELTRAFSAVVVVCVRTTKLLFSGTTILFFALAVTCTGAELPRKCPSVEAKRARIEAGHLQDWNGVYNSFKRYGFCDSGEVAEEYSYTVSRLLAHHWNDIESLLRLAAGDEEFKNFILRHINEDIPEEEAQLIINNSRQHCPADGKWLCTAIVDY